MQISFLFSAQFSIVSEIEEEQMHMGLALLENKSKLDNNGELGALVIVNCGLVDVFFQNMASKISQIDKKGVYWVVMKKRANYFVFSKKGFANYKYNFPFSLQSGSVYSMTIDEKEKLINEETVVIQTNQVNSHLFIDNILVDKFENQIFTFKVPLGNHTFRIEKDGFYHNIIEHEVVLGENIFRLDLEEIIPIQVEINSNPIYAKIYLDNDLVGDTPLITKIMPGNYDLQIIKDGFETVCDSIVIAKPKFEKNYNLVDKRANLTINTDKNAVIRINNEVFDRVKDLAIPAQELSLIITKPKHETINEKIILNENERKSLDYELVLKTGTVKISASPSSAKITLTGDSDEFYKASGKFESNQIPIGKYQLDIKNKGYKSYEQNFNVKQNDYTEKIIDLVEGFDKPKVTLQERFERYMNSSEGDKVFVITTGLSLSLVNATLNDGYDDDEQKFNANILGYNFGFSYLIKPFETGVFITNESSHSTDYHKLKSSKRATYIQIPFYVRGEGKLESGNYITSAFGLYLAKGISKNHKKFDVGSISCLGLRKKKIESEFSFKYSFISSLILLKDYGEYGYFDIFNFSFGLSLRFRI